MWLLHTESLELRSFQGKPPPYAILSHRWGSDEEEVTFQDWRNDHAKISARTGYVKILRACEEAKSRDLEYLWVDTNCIDKSSSAELSEAINSMYYYYEQAEICLAYLQDVDDATPPTNPDSPDFNTSQFCQSAWFTRGWTLQELLAPQSLVFFTSSWVHIGEKSLLKRAISKITGIPERHVSGRNLHEAPISCRMSWVSNRVTTRLEDIAYCMLGIFGVNMPLLYGEGRRAFQRLQEELIKLSDDQTVFAWDWLPRISAINFPERRAKHLVELGWDADAVSRSEPLSRHIHSSAQGIGSGASSLIAPDPVLFYASSLVGLRHMFQAGPPIPYYMTNKGLSITLPLCDIGSFRRFTLAIVTVGRTQIQGQDLFVGGGLFLAALGLQVSTYSRIPNRKDHNADGFFHGHLVVVTMPWELYKLYFRETPIFVRQLGIVRSIFVRDMVPEAAVCILNRPDSQDGNPNIGLFMGAKTRDPFGGPIVPVSLEQGKVACGAIFRISWRDEFQSPVLSPVTGHYEGFLLVRAIKNGDFRPGKPCQFDDGGISAETETYQWRCDVVSPVAATAVEAHSAATICNKRWKMGSRELTLRQALDLPEDPTSFGCRQSCEVLTFPYKVNTVLTACLEGTASWISNPGSSIKFLSAKAVEHNSLSF